MPVKDINKLLSKDNASDIANYIVKRFLNATEENKDYEKQRIDYDYQLTRNGKMSSKPVNTEFQMDAEKPSPLWDVIDAFYHDDETRLPTQEEFGKLDEFIDDVMGLLNTEHEDNIRTAIRQNVLGGADDRVFKLEEIYVKKIEISNPVFPYSVKVLKGATVEDMKSGKVSNAGISQELLDLHIKTGRSFEDLIAEQKALGIEKYRYVFGVELIKYDYHCHVYLYVDYSAVPKGECL